MIVSLSLMPASYPLDESIRLPAGSISRKILIVHSTEDAQREIARVWGKYMEQDHPKPAWIQLDILEGRKPNGFSEAAKSNKLGLNVWVTQNPNKSQIRLGRNPVIRN